MKLNNINIMPSKSAYQYAKEAGYYGDSEEFGLHLYRNNDDRLYKSIRLHNTKMKKIHSTLPYRRFISINISGNTVLEGEPSMENPPTFDHIDEPHFWISKSEIDLSDADQYDKLILHSVDHLCSITPINGDTIRDEVKIDHIENTYFVTKYTNIFTLENTSSLRVVNGWNSTHPDKFYVRLTLPDIYKVYPHIMCNFAKVYEGNISDYLDNEESIVISPDGTIYMIFDSSKVSSLDDIKSIIEDNNRRDLLMQIVYPIQPTIYKLSDEDIVKSKQIFTYNGITVITCDKPMYIKLQYSVSAKTYAQTLVWGSEE